MGGKVQHASSSESDYWGDESWIVDCPCGVSFDDGEEMVECDECGVWVHTACCRVPKGLATFVCDKCKSKKKKESEEVSEIPQPSPQRTSPQAGGAADGMHPPDLFRKPANEVPIHDRVHVQGTPGGDANLFVDVPRVFSQQLWKFTGYVPKAFHSKCKDIPSLPSQDDAPERLLALLPSRKEVSVETKEQGKAIERVKEEDNGNSKKETMITLHMEKHARRESRRVEGKHSKPGHKSSRSNRDGKVQLYVKRGSEDLKRGCEDTKRGCEDTKRGCEDTKRGCEDTKRGCEDTKRGCEDTKRGCEDTKRGCEDMKRGFEDMKRGSDDQNRKESFNKRMRTTSMVVKTEEEHAKEDEVSRSGGEPPVVVIRGQSPVFCVKNPKAMKKMAVQEFMNRHVSALSNRCLNSEQIQLNVA